MKIMFIILLCFIFQIQAYDVELADNCDNNDIKNRFHQFKKKYNKNYATQSEERYRYKKFCSSELLIERHNNNPNKTYKLGINKYADLSFEEFKGMYLIEMDIVKKQDNENKKPQRILMESSEDLPTSFDWRDTNGAVHPVKDQGQCGSCWAFSATTAAENAIWRSQNLSVGLSEQELVSCSKKEGNFGCNGGLMHYAFDYMIKNGLSTSFNFPYIAKNGGCNKNKLKLQPRYSISSYEEVLNDVTDLQRAIYKGIPTVSFEVQDDFQHYSSGVYEPELVCGNNLNHGMVAVGYNFDSSEYGPYFIIQNSWGENWGINGFAHVAWGSGSGVCGLTNISHLPSAN